MSKQSKLIKDIPNFKPTKFDGTRLDKKEEYLIKFSSIKMRNKAYSLLKKEGFKCQKD